MRARLKFGKLLLALLVSCTSLVIAPSFADAAKPPQLAAGVPLSSSINSPPIASGVVLDSLGNPVSGAIVLLYADPLPQDLAPGISVQSSPLSQTLTDTGGAWQLSVPPSDDLGSEVVPGETQPDINFEVRSWTSDGTDVHYFSVPAVQIGNGSNLERNEARIVIHGHQQALDAGASHAKSVRLRANALPVHYNRIVRNDDPAPDSCSTSETGDVYSNRQTQVGAAHSKFDYQTTTFVFKKGTSSSLGIGVSGSGDYGSFTAKGESSVDVSSTQVYPAQHGPTRTAFSSYFTYHKVFEVCYIGPYESSTFKVQPKSFDGGATTGDANYVDWNYCEPYVANSGVILSKKDAYTYTAGVSMAPVGISLSARSGFSTNTSLSVMMGRDGKICGNSAYPGDNPQGLQVRAGDGCTKCSARDLVARVHDSTAKFRR